MEASKQAAFPPRFLPVAAHGIHNVAAGLPVMQEAAQRFGGVLHVAVHQQDDLAVATWARPA